jgi:hypothetical protein
MVCAGMGFNFWKGKGISLCNPIQIKTGVHPLISSGYQKPFTKSEMAGLLGFTSISLYTDMFTFMC